MNTYKSDNNKLLRAFLKYQLIEIAIAFVFFIICSLVFYPKLLKWGQVFLFSIAETVGILIQVFIFLSCWYYCQNSGKSLWGKAKVVLYCSADIIVPLGIFCFFIVVAMLGRSRSSYPNHYNDSFETTCWHTYILFLIIFITKFIFIIIYKRRFAPQKCLKAEQPENKDTADINILNTIEECYDEQEGFICEGNLKYYDEMNYSVYADDARTVISVVFGDKSSGYCRYFTLSESDTESGYEELWRLADTIRANPQSFAEREINIEDLQKEDK